MLCSICLGLKNTVSFPSGKPKWNICKECQGLGTDKESIFGESIVISKNKNGPKTGNKAWKDERNRQRNLLRKMRRLDTVFTAKRTLNDPSVN